MIVATYADYLTEPTPLTSPSCSRRHGRISSTRAWSAGTTHWRLGAPAAPGTPTPTTCAPSSIPPAPPANQRDACTRTTPSCARPSAARCGRACCPVRSALATAPMFHVTGMQHSLNAPIFAAATIVLLPRWDPSAAGYMIERYAVHALGQRAHDGGGFAGAPRYRGTRSVLAAEHIRRRGCHARSGRAEALRVCGIEYMEAYGMTETISQTHMNPVGNLRRQCLGIPTFDTESIVVNPETLEPLPAGETGEIVSRGPQVFKGYWNNRRPPRPLSRRSMARPGCAPAISAEWTTRASSTSPIGSNA